MKKTIISLLVAMSFIFTLAAFSPVSANQFTQQDKTLTGVVVSETVFKADNGNKYFIIGSDQDLGHYIGHKVKAEGLVNTDGSIRIAHMNELN